MYWYSDVTRGGEPMYQELMKINLLLLITTLNVKKGCWYGLQMQRTRIKS
jgi:hypothetical protein